jgi:hypothetical protein
MQGKFYQVILSQKWLLESSTESFLGILSGSQCERCKDKLNKIL